MSSERTPLLGAKVLLDIEEHHRVNNEPDNLHDQREHNIHHHNHHNNHHGHYQSVGQDEHARVEAGERDGENTGLLAADNSDLLDGNEDILEDAEKTTDPYTILGFAFSVLAGICFTSSSNGEVSTQRLVLGAFVCQMSDPNGFHVSFDGLLP